MRVAWPELVALVALGAVLMLAATIGAVYAMVIFLPRSQAGLMFVGIPAVLLLDLWATLRLIDWLFAGPARRAKHRIL